ncbi:MAG: DUF1295 domain-containing protein [Candidatus Pacebacteria bacterium]|nr:DUF1295 domain-containing protein [Candidatus Paceibacterota bacterium]MBP9851307.1 DUF1295 domain-containing protein [Candidatus Paceibacterota bacterium]
MGLLSLLATIIFCHATLWFILAQIKKRNDLADVAWGLGFLIVALVSFLSSGFDTDRGLIVTVLVGVWSLRLSLHIYLRNRNKTEDYRYQAWRMEWGKWFLIRSYLQVFLLQGFLLLVVSAPIIAIGIYRYMNLDYIVPMGVFDYIGIAIWIIGFLFESVGDAQLAKFLKNPENKGKLMQSGLWAYTRHPNYFGEATMWWGIWLIAFSTPYGPVSIVGPMLITFLLLKVSGVPMLEAKMSSHPDFPEYKARVNMFVPWFPKNKNGK